MEIDSTDENQKDIVYDLYIFDEARIVETITNVLLHEKYGYDDYGPDYYYNFYYKNI